MLLKSKKIKAKGTKRRMFRKTRKVPVYTASQVARIARSVTLKTAETKSKLDNYAATNLGDNAVRAWNLTYPLSQGVTSESVLGEKINLKNIRIMGFSRVNSGSGNNNTKIVRLIIFKATKQLASSTPINITPTDLYRNNVTPPQNHVDLHKVDLLYDKMLTLTPSLASQETIVPWTINIPLNRTEYFDSDNSGFFKNKNYYLAIHHYDGNGVYVPTLHQFTVGINFKDE